MPGCRYLLILLLTVILGSSNRRAAEDLTVLTPRIVSKLSGPGKHVMLLINNCNATHLTPPTTLSSKLPNYAMPHFGIIRDIWVFFIPLETLQTFCNKSHIWKEGRWFDIKLAIFWTICCFKCITVAGVYRRVTLPTPTWDISLSAAGKSQPSHRAASPGCPTWNISTCLTICWHT